MAKRRCPFDETDRYVKKQAGVEKKIRGIQSVAAERTLQLLFQGASKKSSKKDNFPCVLCSRLESYTQCYYCDTYLCLNCAGICENCKGEFCQNCSFPNYDGEEVTAVCFSCY